MDACLICNASFRRHYRRKYRVLDQQYQPICDIVRRAKSLNLSEHLAAFKIPRQVHVIDALPRNASGKILKRELRDNHAAATAG